MDDTQPSHFTTALRSFNVGDKLTRSFAEANAHQRSNHRVGYDRTTLGRWLETGSRPRRREFVVYMSALLDDNDTLLKAYDADTAGTGRRSEVKSIETRFGRLDPQQQRSLLATLSTRAAKREPGLRRDVRMRMDLQPDSASSHLLTIGIEWTGNLLDNSTVYVTRNQDDLERAFDDTTCLFRESLPTGTQDNAVVRAPSLRFRDSSGRRVPTEYAEKTNEAGTYQFHNAAALDTQIEFRIQLRYPAALSFYPILFGSYSILGQVEIEATFDASVASQPGAYCLLGPAHHWVDVREEEGRHIVDVQLSDGEVVAPNTGLVLHWQAPPATQT